jgi:hypothetical protein
MYPPDLTLPASCPLQREDILNCIQEYAEIAVWTVEKDVDGNPVVHLPSEDAMVA